MKKLPLVPPVLAASRAWLEGLPAEVRSSISEVFGLLYAEQRSGCWGTPTRYVNDKASQGYTPFQGPHNIAAMIRLPASYVKGKTFQRDIVAQAWPELLAVPFNEPFGRLAVELRARRFVEKVRARLAARLR